MEVAGRLSAMNRKRKWDRFVATFEITTDMRILDVGFNETEYSAVDNFLEKNYPHPEMITALGMEEPVQFSKRYPGVNAIRYDGNVFPFADNQFDICWSNAVIEHVGNFDKQVFFLKELKRVSGAFYITTPNRYFPVEVHTRIPLLHYLPKPVFDRLLPLFGKKWAAGSYMHLLSLSDIKKLLEAAGIDDYEIHGNRLGVFVLDYVIVAKSFR